MLLNLSYFTSKVLHRWDKFSVSMHCLSASSQVDRALFISGTGSLHIYGKEPSPGAGDSQDGGRCNAGDSSWENLDASLGSSA